MLLKNLKKIFVAIGAYSFRHFVGSLNSWVIGPAVLGLFSFNNAVVITFVISILINYFLILLYDQIKEDWFSIEDIKRIREKSEIAHHSKSKFVRRVSAMSNTGVFAFIFIWMFLDSIIVALLSREGSYKFNGIKSFRVWLLFISSNFLSNLAWIGILQCISFMHSLIMGFLLKVVSETTILIVVYIVKMLSIIVIFILSSIF